MKNLLKQLVISSCLMLIPHLELSAQNSGYMGKRFMIGAGIQGNTNELFIHDYQTVKSPLRYHLDLKTAFSAAYSLNRKVSLGLDLNMNKLSMHGALVKLKTLVLGLNCKVFRGLNAPALIGVYTEYQAGFMKYNVLDAEAIFGSKNQKLGSDYAFYIGYGVGRQQMLFKNLTCNIGVDFKLSSFIFDGIERNNIHYYNPSKPTEYISLSNPAYKMLLSYTFNAKIGLGYMIF